MTLRDSPVIKPNLIQESRIESNMKKIGNVNRNRIEIPMFDPTIISIET